jgi:histone acetyltransferase (RNA polymerase elongator complex component)
LKQAGFKVVAHLMPDLPGSSPELDKWMFDQALTNPDLQFDDVKIYPTAIVKSHDPNYIVESTISEWYAKGTYKPYSEVCLDLLIDVGIYYKVRVNPWTRIQRFVRDIPSNSIESGYDKRSNLRQIVHDRMRVNGQRCKCIYCMEVGDRELDGLETKLVVRKYVASKGTEYHLSIEAHTMGFIDKVLYNAFIGKSWLYWLLTGKTMYWSGFTSLGTVPDISLNGCEKVQIVESPTYSALFGFVRLRIDPEPGGDFVEEIRDCGLIREAHVYGTSLGVGLRGKDGSQHRGYGQLLMKTAETICRDEGLKRTAVIAGIGSREYYKNKCGYRKGTNYMLKDIESDNYVRYIVLGGLASVAMGIISVFRGN